MPTIKAAACTLLMISPPFDSLESNKKAPPKRRLGCLLTSLKSSLPFFYKPLGLPETPTGNTSVMEVIHLNCAQVVVEDIRYPLHIVSNHPVQHPAFHLTCDPL
jgi:hypothetical protein